MNKSFNKLIRSNVVLAVLSVFTVILLMTGLSYSLFTKEDVNSTNQVINLGVLSARASATTFTLNDLYPETESSALSKNNNVFNFSLVNDGTYDINYYLYFTLNSNTTTLNSSDYQYIKFKLDDGETHTLEDVYSSSKFSISNSILYRGFSENHTIRFWLDESAVNSVIDKQIVLNLVFDGVAFNNGLKCLDESGNQMTCPTKDTIKLGQRIAIGDQVFRYVRITDTSDTTHTYNECGYGYDENEAVNYNITCADGDSRHTLEDGKIRLMAEYNLYVGAIYNSNTKQSDILETSPGYLLQSDQAIGWIKNLNPSIRVATIAYGSTNSIYVNSNVKYYTELYVEKLNKLYFNGRNVISAGNAITAAELTKLFKCPIPGYCPESVDGIDTSWIYTTSYWTSSSSKVNDAWGVNSQGYFHTGDDCSYSSGYGIRPVIEMSDIYLS